MAALQALAGKFTHLTVGKKLGLGFALLLLLAVVIAGTGAQYLHIIESRADRIDFSNRLNEEINQSQIQSRHVRPDLPAGVHPEQPRQY